MLSDNDTCSSNGHRLGSVAHHGRYSKLSLQRDDETELSRTELSKTGLSRIELSGQSYLEQLSKTIPVYLKHNRLS